MRKYVQRRENELRNDRINIGVFVVDKRGLSATMTGLEIRFFLPGSSAIPAPSRICAQYRALPQPVHLHLLFIQNP